MQYKTVSHTVQQRPRSPQRPRSASIKTRAADRSPFTAQNAASAWLQASCPASHRTGSCTPLHAHTHCVKPRTYASTNGTCVPAVSKCSPVADRQLQTMSSEAVEAAPQMRRISCVQRLCSSSPARRPMKRSCRVGTDMNARTSQQTFAEHAWCRGAVCRHKLNRFIACSSTVRRSSPGERGPSCGSGHQAVQSCSP
jgi:hypothetical protein